VCRQGSANNLPVISMSNHFALIEKTERLEPLSRGDAELLMEEMLTGKIPTTHIVRLLEALNRRQIVPAELSGFATVMRRHAAPVFVPFENRMANLIDTCGTGGDGACLFNISTAAAFVAAGAGARVAKHGNRAVSSRCGSADVLEALGVRIDLPLEFSGHAIRKLGIGFLFAPAAHSATRHAVPARRQIAKRTVFNLLGPLTNPASAEFQVLGVFSPDYLDLVAAALLELGIRRAFVVHGAGGLDEISLAGETLVAEVRHGSVRRFVITPEDFGLQRAPLAALHGGGPTENATIIRKVLAGDDGACTNVVVLNAAAALVVSEIAGDFREAAALAQRSISSGAAREKLEQLVAMTTDSR
jgi:anthranilate phosphoribosyltransferase